MKIVSQGSKRLFHCGVLTGLLCLADVARGATLSLTPSTVSNTFSGAVTLQVGGLTNGETVVIQKYLDVNTNNAIGAGDLLIQSFRLTDGQASVIGGVTNINVPGDSNPVASNITAQLNLLTSGIEQHFIGKYLYRLYSPTARFASVTNLFTITNTPYGQSFTGNVVCSGTNVPNAIVLLFAPSGERMDPQAGAVANNSGSYTIKAAPGTYMLTAFKSNFVADLSASPSFTLGVGATINSNLTLLPTTRRISGRLVNATNTSIGVPGVLVPIESTNNLLTVAFTDTNGNFSAPVTASLWEVSSQTDNLTTHGYLGTNDSPSVNTVTGNVSGVTIAFPKASALIYGSVKDDQNQPLTGVMLYGQKDSGQYDSYTATDQNGYYVLGVNAGIWAANIDSSNPDFAGYVFSTGIGSTNLTDGQAVLQDIVARAATNRITGYLKDGGDNPISGISMWCDGNINGNNYRAIGDVTGPDGSYSINVASGCWWVGANCYNEEGLESLGLCCVENQNVCVTNADAVVNFTALQPGQVTIATPPSLPDAEAGSDYWVQLEAFSCQAPFNWSLSPGSDPLPPGLDLYSNGAIAGTPTTAGSNYFSVRATDVGSHTADKAFSLVVTGLTSDVAMYYVSKMKSFQQSDPVTIVLDTNDEPFNASVGIIQSSLGSVPLANVTLPTSAVKGFPSGGTGIELRVDESFSSEALFDTACPPGNYSFALYGINDGLRFPVLFMPSPVYPSAPRVSNFAMAHSIDPTTDFELQWDVFSGGTTNDVIWVVIMDGGDNPVFSTPYPPTDPSGSLKGNATSVIIPAGVFQFDGNYTGMIGFFRVTSADTTTYPGAVGMTIAGSMTAFPLTTLSAAPTVGQVVRLSPTQFGFNLGGVPGSNYTILATTNLSLPLSNWFTVLVTNLPASPIFFQDNQAAGSQRFYRVQLGP